MHPFSFQVRAGRHAVFWILAPRRRRARPASAGPRRSPARSARRTSSRSSSSIPTIQLDVRYATANNFAGRPVYARRALSCSAPRRRLWCACTGRCARQGLRPARLRRLSAVVGDEALLGRSRRRTSGSAASSPNPAKGSKHNRGCAVDLSLYDLATGREVEMPSPYDEMSPTAPRPDYAGGTAEQRARRDLLRAAMEREGFAVEPERVVALQLQGLARRIRSWTSRSRRFR